jgi:hypothetical protein
MDSADPRHRIAAETSCVDSTTESTDMGAATEPAAHMAAAPKPAAHVAATAATATSRFCCGCQQSGRDHCRCNCCYQSFHDVTPVQQLRAELAGSARGETILMNRRWI